MFIYSFAILLLLAAVSLCFAASDRVVQITPHLFTPQRDASLYFAPIHFNKTLIGPFNPNYANKDTGYFYIAQWNNPSPITETDYIHRDQLQPSNSNCFHQNGTEAATTATPLWSIENSNLRVCTYSNATSPSKNGNPVLQVQLAQNGFKTLQCGLEYDLFLAPNNFPQYSINNNAANNNRNPVNLGSIKSLDFSFGLELLNNQVNRRCSAGEQNNCGPSGKVDYGYITLGVAMSNPTAKQTIFYQILLYDTREATPACGFSDDVCSIEANNDMPSSWYFNTLPTLGVNFKIGAFLYDENNCLSSTSAATSSSSQTKVWYNSTTMNQGKFLASFVKSVQQAQQQFGANGNLSNWEIGDFYLGSGIQGDVSLTTTVTFEKFEATVRD